MYPPAHRTLAILELLADMPDGLALSAIAAELALPKSAAHRLLAGLAERGFVQQHSDTQHYALTLKLAALGFRHLAATRIEEICQPVLNRLARRQRRTRAARGRRRRKMTWVAKAQGALSGLRYDADAGRDVVLHATAVGKAWLASLPEETGAGDRRAHRLRGASAPRSARRADAGRAAPAVARHAQARVRRGRRGRRARRGRDRRRDPRVERAWRAGRRDGQHRRSARAHERGAPERTARRARVRRRRTHRTLAGARTAAARAGHRPRTHAPEAVDVQ